MGNLVFFNAFLDLNDYKYEIVCFFDHYKLCPSGYSGYFDGIVRKMVSGTLGENEPLSGYENELVVSRIFAGNTMALLSYGQKVMLLRSLQSRKKV